MSDGTARLGPRLGRELEALEMEYMELHERGEFPSLEELIERYRGSGEAEREMRARIVEFVLDFVSLEAAAARVVLTEEELERAEEATRRATKKVLGYDPEDPEDAARFFDEKYGR